MDSSQKHGLKEMGNPKIRFCDGDLNLVKIEDGDVSSDSFVIDLERLSNGLNRDSTLNTTSSRITLQRSLSRKGPQRGAERNMNDEDNQLSPSSSPRGAQVNSMLEKPLSPPNPSDHTSNNQLPQHQIIIKASGLNPLTDGKWGKRSSFKRRLPSWFSNPKRVLLFFATLSSIGTLLLIYFTLSLSNAKEVLLDWQ